MRRLTGLFEGVPVEVLDIAPDHVECPPALRPHLVHPRGSLPSGVELEQVCRLLFGDTFAVEEL